MGDINASNFGVALKSTKYVTAGGAISANVDYIEITVDYTAAGGCTNPNSSAISFVGSGGPTSSGNVSSLSFNQPTGTVSGDVMLAQVTAYRTGSTSCRTVTTPSGWTLIRSDFRNYDSWGTSNDKCVIQSLYWKAASAATGSVSFTLSGSAYATGSIVSYRGVNTSSPILTSSGQGNISSSSIVAPAVSAISSGNMLVGLFGIANGSTNMTPPSSPCLAERRDANTGSSPGVAVSVADGPIGAGSTGTVTDAADSSALNVGQLVLLQAVPVVLAPASFNAFDTSTTVASPWFGYIKTKQAATSFQLKVIALNAGKTALSTASTNPTITLVANNSVLGALDANNCPTSFTTLATLSSSSFTGSTTITVPNTAVTNAWKDVRVKMTAGSTTGCSNDNFAIRPTSFSAVAAKDADWTTAWTTGAARTLNNTGATGGTVHAAGQPFTLQATATNGAGNAATNYVGTPEILITACPLPAGCATDGSGSYSAGIFNPGTFSSSSGVVTSTTATYSETGTFAFQLIDDDFAGVDSADGTSSDCSGRYICSSAATVGRFVPDHFEFSLNDPTGTAYPTPQLQTFGSSCASRSFTYVGQAFGYAQVPQVLLSAVNAGGDTTANYLGFESSPSTAIVTATYPTPTLTRIDNGATLTSPPAFDTSAAGTLTVTPDGPGTAVVAIPTSASFKFERSSQVVPFAAAINLSLDANDTSETGVTIAASATADFFPLAFDEGNAFRYGRLRLSNAYGSVSPIYMPVEAQYWSGLSWVKNTDDSCTTSTGGTPQVSFPPITDWTLTPNAFAAGMMGGGGLKIEKAATGTTIINATVPDWLKPDPSARASIGIYGTKESRKAVHVRELY